MRRNKEEWPHLTPMQVHEEIREREKLQADSNEHLHRLQLNEELSELRTIWYKFPNKIRFIIEGVATRERNDNWCPSEQSYQMHSIGQDSDIKYLLDQLYKRDSKLDTGNPQHPVAVDQKA